MKGFYRGVGTAMITPFYDNGSVNYDAMEKLVDYQLDNGVAALIILGTTGEAATMTKEEKVELMKWSVAKVKGKAKVIFGTGSNCTQTAVENSILAESLGADGILVVTPYYNKCTQKGIVAYYKTICEAVSIPVIAYNVPGRTGVNILPETAREISLIPNMAGIKEASGNMAQVVKTMSLVRDNMDVYSGEDCLNFPIMAIGGAGVISVASNLAPLQVKQVCDAVFANDLATAQRVHDSLLPLMDACFVEVNPIPVKEGCNLLGFEAGTPRAPLTKLEDKNALLMAQCLEKLGLKA